MAHVQVWRSSGAPLLRAASTACGPPKAEQARTFVHVVDGDVEAQELLCRWLTAEGLSPKVHSDLDAFLNLDRADQPGCVVIEAQLALSSLLPEQYPTVVTALQADVATAVNAMKKGAVDFVEKPFREQEIVAAIRAAIEIDRQRRLAAAQLAELHARYATLSGRERQVMALVTAGRLNKQVGGDLGLSEITVKAHRGAVMRKMAARSLAALVRMADALSWDSAA